MEIIIDGVKLNEMKCKAVEDAIREYTTELKNRSMVTNYGLPAIHQQQYDMLRKIREDFKF